MNEKYAIAGIKYYIDNKKKFIEGLLNQSQSWNEESKETIAQLTKGIANHLTRDVEYFERLLKLIEEKKKSKDNSKTSKIPLDPKIKAEIERQVQFQVNEALKKKYDSERKKKSL